MAYEFKGYVNDFDSFISFLSVLAKMIAESFGANCEVAISSLDNMNQSVLAIYNGEVTGREVGAPLNPDTRKRLQNGNGGISVNYRKNIKFSQKAIKSSTIVLKAFGHNISFCINVDCSKLESISAMLNSFLYMDEDTYDIVENEASFQTKVTDAVQSEIKKLKKTDRKLTKSDRMTIINNLQKAGIFQIKRSTTIVADSLGISRYTVYNYMKECSNGSIEDGAASTGN